VYIFIDFRLLRRCSNERKIRFHRNCNIYSGDRNVYSAGNVYSTTFIRQCTYRMCAPRVPPPSLLKIRRRKGFRCCGRSFAARVPHETATWNYRTDRQSRHTRRSINGGRLPMCGLVKSNRNCDQPSERGARMVSGSNGISSVYLTADESAALMTF